MGITRKCAWLLTCENTHDTYRDVFWLFFAMLCMNLCEFMHIWCHCISYLFDPVYALMHGHVNSSVSVFICAVCGYGRTALWCMLYVTVSLSFVFYASSSRAECEHTQDHKCFWVITYSSTASLNEAFNICLESAVFITPVQRVCVCVCMMCSSICVFIKG